MVCHFPPCRTRLELLAQCRGGRRRWLGSSAVPGGMRSLLVRAKGVAPIVIEQVTARHLGAAGGEVAQHQPHHASSSAGSSSAVTW